MANIKTPCLSFGAHGTVGKAITFTERQGQKIAEKKPKLPYFLTLPVQYQRWLYQDYAYLWTQQTPAVKQVYASAGVKCHLTGFQYWMSYQLTYLPDIVGWWKMDTSAGGLSPESSRNHIPTTIVGATPATGQIDGAYYFDGLNDHLLPDDVPALHFRDAFTIEVFARRAALLELNFIAARDDGVNRCWQFFVHTTNKLWGTIWSGGIIYTAKSTINLNTTDLYHFILRYDLTKLEVFVNNIVGAVAPAVNTPVDDDPVRVTIGRRLTALFDYWNGLLDNLIIYNRALDDAEIQRRSARRWPQK